MKPGQKDFYEYYAAMLEPWDGPAAICFTDGVRIGATLDRNGLRPARYLLTTDDIVILASEAGTLPIPESKIKKMASAARQDVPCRYGTRQNRRGRRN